MESNHRPPPYQGGALPTELREQVLQAVRTSEACRVVAMERETGIEPALVAWKATVLPLNYSRAGSKHSAANRFGTSLPLLRQSLVRRPGVASCFPPLPINRKWWREVDSNHRRRKPADLQSAPVGRLGIPPKSPGHASRKSLKQPAILTGERISVNARSSLGPIQTLNRKCRTSPSWTRYSLPSRRRRPASRAPASPL